MDRSRCPACSAAVRPDAQWCSLCFADLRPPQPKPQQPQQPAQPQSVRAAVPTQRQIQHQPAVGSETTAPAAGLAPAPATEETAGNAAGWPCTSCEAVVPLDLAACPVCGAAFLSRLAGDAGRHRSSTGSGLGDNFTRLPRGARVTLGMVIGFLIALLIPTLLALLG